ncbi:DNA polymerase I [Candidatus Pandoraea novymonadis]|uniref:DNA polymerase I n=1 Tax=Candidatus Pandoraea novymonadis TaxID=1808959 RepID=A0ABX5FF57_9BURK|nr:DNA polymerase I [Candidatus Pandoraea novymonadis]PSB92291.1 DNA polymerase I [Candidatus Pandoraea novymonadis]
MSESEQPRLDGKTLLLVDGSSYVYRAYHALPDLRGPSGEPTGALHGIVNMLRRLRKDVDAQFSACVFDAKGKTFRNDLYPDYKANRPSMPDNLRSQIKLIHEAVHAMGWPMIMIEGIEADDVIGTLARRAAAKGMRVIISTGDKDLAQLVDQRITLVNTMTMEMLDQRAVEAKFGVPPELIIDYLTLVGDAVDNVPGVMKCGPKTAIKWLTQYGDLDRLIANAEEIKGIVGENLRQALDWLPLSRKLITIATDCNLMPQVETIEKSLLALPENRMVLIDFFRRHGFKILSSEMEIVGADVDELSLTAVDATIPLYDTVLTWASFDAWLKIIQTAAVTALDTETTSLDAMMAEIVGLSVAVEPGRAAYIPLGHRTGDAVQLPRDQVLARLKPWIEDAQYKKVGQNLKYDTHVLENYGIRLNGVSDDTMLQSYVLESHRTHDMTSLAFRHLGMKIIKYEEICGKGTNQICFDQISIEQATKYAAQDADISLRLHLALSPEIEKVPGLKYVYHNIELPTAYVLQRIERNGVFIDTELLAKQSEEIGIRLIYLEDQAYALAGKKFNLNSPKQISEIFFTQLKLPIIKKTASGAPSTDEEVLQKLAEDYPLPKVLLNYRGLAKLKSTYTDKLSKMVNANTGRVHTNYAQAVAITGRLVSNDPNLQNIPIRTAEGRRIREAFIANNSRSQIVSADYSQIELRIMAHISGDENLLCAFCNGEDIHRATASEIFGVTLQEVSSEQRRYAKVINFGLIYGMSAFGLASNLGIEREAAKQYIDRYFMRYPGVAKYMEETRRYAKAYGYVETVFGRRLWLPDINGGNSIRRQASERAAINAPMQGTAADLIKLSMIAVQSWIEEKGMEAKQIMQVHDELVLEVPDTELALVKKRLPELMCSVAKLKVPLVAELGSGVNWGEAH